ncbi:unnamed protein product, partial [Brassica oleracea]
MMVTKAFSWMLILWNVGVEIMVMKGLYTQTTSKKPSITKAGKSSSLPYPLIPFLARFYAISNPVPRAEAANLSEE